MQTLIINASDRNALSESVKVLRKGGIIIYPTETCYGMGVDATNTKAVRKIYRIKGRERLMANCLTPLASMGFRRSATKPISIIVSDMKMIKKYAFLNEDAEILMKKFMPGPLTLVARKKNIDGRLRRRALLPDALSKKTVGFRIPANKFALRLVKRYGKPITATSANISGKPPIYRIDGTKKAFYGKVDMIIDAGNLPERKPSTVFDAENRKMIRKGSVTKKQITNALQ